MEMANELLLDESAQKVWKEEVQEKSDEALQKMLEREQASYIKSCEESQKRLQELADGLVEDVPMNQYGDYELKAHASNPLNSLDRLNITFAIHKSGKEEREFGTEFNLEWSFDRFRDTHLNGHPGIRKGTIGNHGISSPEHLMADVAVGHLAGRILSGQLVVDGSPNTDNSKALHDAHAYMKRASISRHVETIVKSEIRTRKNKIEEEQVSKIATGIEAKQVYVGHKYRYVIETAGPKRLTITPYKDGYALKSYREGRINFAWDVFKGTITLEEG